MLEEFRAKYPGLSDISDDDFGYAIHKEFFSDINKQDFDTVFFGVEPEPDWQIAIGRSFDRVGDAFEVAKYWFDPDNPEVQRDLAQSITSTVAEQAANPYSEETLQEFNDFSKVSEEGLWPATKFLLTNPDFTGILLAEQTAPLGVSLLGVAGGQLVGSAVGAPLGPVGSGVGAFAGRAAGAGIPSGILEYASTLQEELTSRGVPVTEESIMEGLQDREFMESARERASARGIRIGLFDAMSGGLAGMLFRPVSAVGARLGAPVAGKVGGVTAELSAQAAAGMGGEAAAQIGDPKYRRIYDLGSIAAEGVLEFAAGGPVEIAAAALTRPGRDRLGTDVNALLGAPPAPVGADQDVRVPTDDGGQSLSELQIGELEAAGAPNLAEALRSLNAKQDPTDAQSAFVFEPEYSNIQHKNIQDLVDFVGKENINLIEPVIEFSNEPLTGSSGGATFQVGGKYFSGLEGESTGRIQVDPRVFPLSTLWHEHKHHISATLRKLDPEAHKSWLGAFKPARSFKAGLSNAVQRVIGRDMVDAFDQRLKEAGATMDAEELMAHAFQAYKEAESRNILPSQRKGAKPGVLTRAFDTMSNYFGRVINVLSGRGMTQIDAFNYVLDGSFMRNLNVQLGLKNQESKARDSAAADTKSGERDNANVETRKETDRISFDTGELLPGTLVEVQSLPKARGAKAKSSEEASDRVLESDILEGTGAYNSDVRALSDDDLLTARDALRGSIDFLGEDRNEAAPNRQFRISSAKADLESVESVLQQRDADKELGVFRYLGVPIERGPVDGAMRVSSEPYAGDVFYSSLVESDGNLYSSLDTSRPKVSDTYQPKQTVRAYKLFRRFKRTGDALHPLFVKMSGGGPLPIGEWIEAELGSAGTKPGKVKSRLGDLAFRPGFHAGDLPLSTHIGGRYSVSSGQRLSSKVMDHPNIREDNQVWAEVEFPADTDWQSVANDRAVLKKDGTVNEATAHITDQIPKDGFYLYKTNPNMTGNWLISGNMKINRVLSRQEVQSINAASGLSDLPTIDELRARVRDLGIDPVDIGIRESFAARAARKPQFSRLVNDTNQKFINPPNEERFKAIGTSVEDILTHYAESNRQTRELEIEGTGKPNKNMTHGKDVLAKDIGKAFNDYMRSLVYAGGLTKEPNSPLLLADKKHYESVRASLRRELALQFRQAESGMGWYDNDIKDVMEIASKIYPQLREGAPAATEYRIMLTLFAAPMSNGNKAKENMEQTVNNFGVWLDKWETTGTSEFPTINKFSNQQYGMRGKIVSQHISMINNIINTYPPFRSEKRAGEAATPDINLFLDWLFREHTADALNEMRSQYGQIKSKLAGVRKGDVRLGAYIFGQKFGPFFSNMNGITDETVDAWASRSIYRHMGDMLVREGKDAGNIVNGPQSVADQPLIKQLIRDVTEDLRLELGGGTRDLSGRAVWLSNYYQNFSTRDVQAMLWFFEKDLWNALGYKTAKDVYSDGAKVAQKSFLDKFKTKIEDSLKQNKPLEGETKDGQRERYTEGARVLMGAAMAANSRGVEASERWRNTESAERRAQSKRVAEIRSELRSRGFTESEISERLAREGLPDIPVGDEPKRLGAVQKARTRPVEENTRNSRLVAPAAAVRLARRAPQDRAWSVRRGRQGVGGYGLTQDDLPTYEIAEQDRLDLEEAGFSAPAMVEARPSRFEALIKDAAASTPAGAAVYIYPQDEYAAMRLFTTKDGTAGFALKGDDIVSVFKHRRSPHKSITVSMLRLAVEQGGRKLDAFDTILPSIYSQSGFRIASRLPWDDGEAPPAWDKTARVFSTWNLGEPDVVFMYYDPNYDGSYAETEGYYADNYDEAVSMQGQAVADVAEAYTPLPNFREGTREDGRLEKVGELYDRLKLETVDQEGRLIDIATEEEPDISYGIIPPNFSMLVNGVVTNTYAARPTPFFGRLLNLDDMRRVADLWQTSGGAFQSASVSSRQLPGIAYPVGRGGQGGFGQRHIIERGHVEELKLLGFKDDVEALDYVGRRYKSYDMYKDNTRDGNIRIEVDKRVGNLTHKVRVVTQIGVDPRSKIPFLGVVTMFPIMAKSSGDRVGTNVNTRGKRRVDKRYTGVRYSRLQQDPRSAADLALADKVGQRRPSMVRRVFSELRDIASGVRSINLLAEGLDAYSSIRNYTEKGYKRARLSNDTASVVAEMTVNGPAKFTERGFVPLETDAQGREIRKPGLLEIFSPTAQRYGDEGLHLLGAYMYAYRARRLIQETNPDGSRREKLLSAGEISQLLDLSRRYPEFEVARQKYVEFNDILLDNAVATGLLSPELAVEWKRHGDYVPFYRADIDPQTRKGRMLEQEAKGGVGRVGKASQTLRGSVLKTQGIIPNIIKNAEYLISKSIRNHAMDVIVREVGPGTTVGHNDGVLREVTRTYVKGAKTTDAEVIRTLQTMLGDEHPLLDNIEAELEAQRRNPDAPPSAALMLHRIGTFEPRESDNRQKVIHVRREGESKFYEVRDEELFKALTYIPSRNLNRLMRIFNFQRTAFSQMITKVPDFLQANLMRDTLSTRALYGGYEPLTSAIMGAKSSLTNDTVMRELRLNGGTALGGYHTDSTLRRYKNLTGDTNNPLILTAKNSWALMDRVSEAAENANRVAVFKQAKKEGADLFEAGFRARDVLDFGLTGRSKVVKTFITIVPFLNARMQGTYRLARGATQKGNRMNFLLWGGLLASAAVALRLDNEDDERYRALPDTSKDLYIHFWLDNYLPKETLKSAGIENPHVAIPKPFELGFIAMTVPERMAAAAIQDADQKPFSKAVKSFGWGIHEIFKVNPLELAGPIGKGVLEDVLNRNWHYDRPIVPKQYEKYKGQPYEAENVVDPYASEAMKALARVLDIAPQRAQNYMDSIFPKVGNMIMTALDGFYREANGLPPVPREFRRSLLGQATWGRFRPEDYPNITQHEKDLRELAAELRASYNAIRTQEKTNVINPAPRTRELLTRHKDELMQLDVVNNTLKEINGFYRDTQEIMQSDDIEASEKLEWKRRISRWRGDLALNALKQVRTSR